jgi:formamidopyrimidine-DNA glycosylase
MPELPDVEGYRVTLAAYLPEARVRDAKVLDAGVLRNATAEAFRDQLVGCRFGQPERRGKWLVLPTDGPMLLIRNGMTGHPYFKPAGVHPETHPHDRLVIGTDHGELRYADLRQLRGVWILPSHADITDVIGEQGPDALGISTAGFRAALRGRRGAVKTVLMNQHVLAGLGNMLSDEICWRAGLHPGRPATSLDDQEMRQLHRVMQHTLRTAVRHQQIPRTRNWLNSARDRNPAPCPRCRTPLRRSAIGGRTSIWCPFCQP